MRSAMSQVRVFVLEVGRPIRADVEREFGHVDAIVSVPRVVSELEIPKIAAQCYREIMKLAQGGNEVYVVLSGPLGLAFQLGQAIGLAHAKVVIYQFGQGKYVRVPPLTREHLFQAQEV
jgi:hypothetical protein